MLKVADTDRGNNSGSFTVNRRLPEPSATIGILVCGAAILVLRRKLKANAA